MPQERKTIQKNYRARVKAKEETEQRIKESKELINLNIIDFFTAVTGLTPTQKQTEVLQGLENPKLMNILISAGRQTGKSLCCAVSAIHQTIQNKVQICLVSAKDNYVYQHITEIFSSNPELRQFVAWEGTANIVPKDGYSLKNGSKVLLLSSSEKGIRGASASVLYLDEGELMPNETLSTAFGNLSGQKIKLVILGTPSTHYSKFNEILKNPKKFGFTAFNWSEIDCNWHTQEELDNKKKIMSEDEWKRDVLGEISSADTKLLWDTEQINKCIKESVFTEGGIREAGLDVGGTGHTDRDQMCLTILERSKSSKYKIKVLLTKQWGFDEVKDAPKEIGDLCRQYRVQLLKVDSLPPYWTEIMKENFDKNRVFPVTMKAYKEEMIGKLTHIIESQGLELPIEYEGMIQQLKAYKEKGNPHYDDYVDSLLLAAFWNDELFPIKPATGGCAVFINVNDHSTFGNYGKYLNNAPSNNNSVSFPNRFKKGLCSR
jgi:hypothetical protein